MRLTLLTVWLGVTLLASSAVAQDASTTPIQPPAPEFAADVTIFSSRNNQNAFDKAELDYRRGVKFWADLCDQAGLSFRVAGDYELETGPAKSKVYVLHYLERLTLAQRKNLQDLKESGAALVVIGLAGAADNEGNATPPSLAEDWFQLRDVRPYTPEKSAYFITLPPSPLALTIDPGRRFEFQWSGRYTMANLDQAVAANSDWLLIPLPDAPTFAQNAVISFRDSSEGRMAWFGVPPDAVVDEGDAVAMFNKGMVQTLRWLARHPAVAACHWQGCAQSAAVVTADVEDKFETGDAIALACHKEGIKGSFFLVGKLAPEYPEVVTAMSENGDIGTHSVGHGSFKDRPYNEQLQELDEGKACLEKLGVPRVTGFRPPMEEFDYDTLRAVARSGLLYLYGNLDYDRAYPIVREVEGKFVYQFARIVADDYNLVVLRGVANATEYQREYFKEFQRMDAMGGLFPFSFHTNYLALQESVDVVRAMVVRLKQEDVWLTTFGDIVDWLEARRQVSVAGSLDGTVTVLTVTNTSSNPVKAFPLRLYPPTSSRQLELVATPQEGLSIGQTTDRGVIILVDLLPQETKVIKLR